MNPKLIFKYFTIFCLFFTSIAKANDITSMSNISDAAGSSAQAAADQLASDADKVVANISGATDALGEAKSDIGKALDASIEQAESAKGTNIRDLKEMYHYYPNGRCPDYLADITQRVFQELYLLARQVLAWIEQGLPSSVQSNLSCALSDMIVDSPNTLYRLLHYPPLTGHEAKGTIRAAAHADICLLTVLPAATAKGLQILTRQGEWIDVPVKKSSMIINIGDMLQECTHAFYPSTQHRVINPDHVDMNQSRLSMPLFLHPADDVVLSDQYTALSYRMERLGELGLL